MANKSVSERAQDTANAWNKQNAHDSNKPSETMDGYTKEQLNQIRSKTNLAQIETQIKAKYKKELDKLYERSNSDKGYQEKVASKKMEERIIEEQNGELEKARTQAAKKAGI